MSPSLSQIRNLSPARPSASPPASPYAWAFARGWISSLLLCLGASACLPWPMVDADGDGHLDGVEDCADHDAAVYPGAVEQCNGRDDDCDGVADNVSGTPCTNPSLDEDGDGFSPNDGDCVDLDSSIYPGADDACDDDLDSDCDGVDPACPISLSQAYASFVGEDRGDMTGATLAAGDFDGDGQADLAIGAPFNSSFGTAGGAVYIVDGPLPAGDWTLDSSDVRLLGDSDSLVGISLATGDFNQDGVDDLLVGASAGDVSDRGFAYLVFGPIVGSQNIATRADLTLRGPANYSAFGSVVLNAGDVDWDGIPDLLVSAPNLSGNAGAAYLFSSDATGTLDASSASAIFTGEASGDFAGSAMAGDVDLDRDGYSDLVICADSHSVDANDYTGSCYVYYGPVSGIQPLADADARLSGETSYDHFGDAVCVAGDLDGDGFSDLAFGAPDFDGLGMGGMGAVYPLQELPLGDQRITEVGIRMNGMAAGSVIGSALARGADLTGDGWPELVIGAPRSRQVADEAGMLHIVLGPLTQGRSLGPEDITIAGVVPGSYTGQALMPMPDAIGDAKTALIIGAPGLSTLSQQGSVEGRVYVLFIP